MLKTRIAQIVSGAAPGPDTQGVLTDADADADAGADAGASADADADAGADAGADADADSSFSDENSLLDTLPQKMKADLAIHVHFSILSKVQLFQVASTMLLNVVNWRGT